MRDDDDRMRSGSAIIVVGLAVGVAAFLAVGWYLWHQDAPREPAESAPLLSNISAAVLVVALLARLLLRKAMQSVENGWRQFVVAGAAAIEFAGLFGCVAYLLEGTDLAFGVGAVSIALIIVLQYPSQGRWEQWSNAARREGRDPPDHYEM